MAETIVYQQCNKCGHMFGVKYSYRGYEYVGEPCDCESDFHPVDGPSYSEWLESSGGTTSEEICGT